MTIHWYRADVTRPTHPKIKKLARRLGVTRMHAIGIHEVLCVIPAVAGRADGFLGSMDAEDLAIAVDWEGDHEVLLETLVSLAIVDRDPDGSLYVHGFAEQFRTSVRRGLGRCDDIEGMQVYLLRCPQLGILKIGESISVQARLNVIRAEMPPGLSFELVAMRPGRDAVVHERFAAFRLARQDGLPAPTEWFEDRPEIRAFFAEVE
jgi:hypothetical protein